MCTCWTITKVSEEADPKEVGVTNPERGAFYACLTSEAIQNHPEAVAFRMKDGDDNIVYEGKMVLGDESDAEFSPLDDFGKPNYGCTSIEILKDGVWKEV
jgi:hypothetical protein